MAASSDSVASAEGPVTVCGCLANRSRARLSAVRKMAEANGFTVSRVPAVMRPPQRRHRTGRNAQLNFKVTPETLAQFTAIADREKWLLAETLEHALDALTG